MGFTFVEENQEKYTTLSRIKAIGVGGGGTNAINRMYLSQKEGSISKCLDFAVINTDLQALNTSPVAQRIQIGAKLTKGLGTGGNAELGLRAANEDRQLLAELLQGYDMVFIAAGMGGGTGTGAAPVIAEIAKEQGCLTIAVVTKPFHFEGSRRMQQAEQGQLELLQRVDTIIVIPNQRLLTVVDKNMGLEDAFKIADRALHQGIQGIADLITIPGLINLDFADVRAVMSNKGNALMGIGVGRGENRALQAAEEAISSPLLEDNSIEGAKDILINITGGTDLKLYEVNEAANFITEHADPEVNVIFGAVINEEIQDELRIIVIATGFSTAAEKELPKEEGRILDIHQYRQRQKYDSAEEFNKKIVNPSYTGQIYDVPAIFRRKQRIFTDKGSSKT
jgi:cell division protein FtsZ